MTSKGHQVQLPKRSLKAM